MHHGEIHESGTHAELLEHGELYARLYRPIIGCLFWFVLGPKAPRNEGPGRLALVGFVASEHV